MEMVGTFLLVSVILNIKRNSTSKFEMVNGMAICTTLYGIIRMIGPMTGGCFNPAVGIAQTIYQLLMLSDIKAYSFPIYIIAPLLGGILAGCFCYLAGVLQCFSGHVNNISNQ